MSDNTTPVPAERSDRTTPEVGADGVVYAIQSTYHSTDWDNHPTQDEEILVEEGWFADKASAEIRCEQLNEKNRSFYNTTMAASKRAHDAKVRAAEKTNEEAAAIRAAGLVKKDVPVPSPFEPRSFESFLRGNNHTSYEVVSVSRSDHDGIAQAVSLEEVVAQVAEPEKQVGTRG